MLVTFKTTAYADITMFGDAATDLLKLMGQSGNVPGAIMGEDVVTAMDSLKQQLASQPDSDANTLTHASDGTGEGREEGSDEHSNRVALATRAVPLLELLEAASASGANVVWDS